MENVESIHSTPTHNTSTGGEATGYLKFVAIAFATAASGVLIKLFQGVGDTNVLVSTIVHTLIVLMPAAITYFMLSREQEKRLDQVVSTLKDCELAMKDLKRVSDIEKNYFANDQLLRLERQVIESTGSSMHEVAELVAEFDDESTAHVRLKERFKVHAKSIQTFHRVFSIEVEGNLRTVAQIENEFAEIPHDERDQLHYTRGQERAERVFQRHNLQGIVDGVTRITEENKKLGALADEKTRAILQTVNANTDKGETA